MKWDHIENRWKDFTDSARARWGKLTDDDWQAMTGTRGHLIGRIQKRYDISREEAGTQVEEWSDALTDVESPSRP